MDTSSFTCFTPEVIRLSTFAKTPLPNQQTLRITNSPAKLAQAGFRRNVDAENDDVTCAYCGVTYGGWSGESPFAVHRVLNERCPFLNTPPPATSIQHHPRVVEARRRLFPVDDERNDKANNDNQTGDAETPEPYQTPYVSVLGSQAAVTHPFKPKVGGFSMMFASRRLETFTNSTGPECNQWAEDGFVFKQDTSDVQCVFCSCVLPFDAFDPKQMHLQNSPYCPNVLCLDVGNISVTEEEHINLKNLQRQLKNKGHCPYAISYPQYEDKSVRSGTYENWPLTSWHELLQPSLMVEAGFFFTGCADKVRCFSCGLGLYRWQHGSAPWEQHAKHMPTCPHLQQKGQHFIAQAANVQILTEADLPARAGSQKACSNTGLLATSLPGSATLDLAAINAAVSTGQYTLQQIRHAVLTFFLQTSRYPTKDILLGTLQAADINFKELCKQRDSIHRKDTVIQKQGTELQQKARELLKKDTVIQQQGTELQQHVGHLEERNQVIQRKDEEIGKERAERQREREELQKERAERQREREELERERAERRREREELERERAEVERKTRQVRHQDQQIESLRLQVQALLAERRLAGQGAAALQPANPAPRPAGDDGAGLCEHIRCKVCMSEESNTIFQPCLHVSCCRQCAQQLLNTPCPVCRVKISDVMPAYIS